MALSTLHESVTSQRLEVGRSCPIYSEELEVNGMGRVTAITACPPLAEGPGEIVTARFVTRQVQETVRVTFSTGDILEGTTIHPVWSPDRQDWVPLGDFVVGDTVQTRDGMATVTAVVFRQHGAPVYNLEVRGQHVYEVTHSGILVHNAGPTCNAGGSLGPRRITGAALAQMRKDFNAIKPQAWMDEAAKNAHKYSPEQLTRMLAGQTPIGADGFPMEIHHIIPLAEGGVHFTGHMRLFGDQLAVRTTFWNTVVVPMPSAARAIAYGTSGGITYNCVTGAGGILSAGGTDLALMGISSATIGADAGLFWLSQLPEQFRSSRRP